MNSDPYKHTSINIDNNIYIDIRHMHNIYNIKYNKLRYNKKIQ